MAKLANTPAKTHEAIANAINPWHGGWRRSCGVVAVVPINGGLAMALGQIQEQGANWVVPPPSAPLLELAPLALLSFLALSRHTRRSALGTD
jgi:hypothetical protein